MRHLFALSMLLAGLFMTALAPTASLQKSPGQGASGNTCDFGDPLVAAECANTNGNRGLLGHGDYGAYGYHNTGNYGYLGSTDYGVYGRNTNDNFGYLAGPFGAFGENANQNRGSLGGFLYGAYGEHFNLNTGYLGGSQYGAYGENINDNYGALGGGSYGVFGRHHTGNIGFLGSTTFGVWGTHDNGNFGFLGSTNYGAYGEHNNGHFGRLGGSFYGALGQNSNTNRGYLGHDSYGVWGTGSPWAGYFQGNVHVTGTLSGGSAASKVDHPLDPEGKYLAHAFVESPDMMNVYNGIAVLDANGEALVALPAYFEALNRNFRYQLTAVGTPGPNLYVAEKIQGNRFKIAGGTPGMEVSWQVTGIRHDPWAEAHRLVVEEDKPADERGFYLHPALYGQPAERSVEWARDPEGMREVREIPQRLEEEQRQMEEERARMEAERRQIEQERQHMDDERVRIQTEQEQRSPRPGNGA